LRARTSAWWTSRSINCRCGDIVADHLSPAAEDLVAGDDQAGAFIARHIGQAAMG
jgi:hypothetical protein